MCRSVKCRKCRSGQTLAVPVPPPSPFSLGPKDASSASMLSQQNTPTTNMNALGTVYATKRRRRNGKR